MPPDFNEFLAEHSSLTRRYFLRFGTAGVAAMGALPVIAKEGEYDPELAKSIDDVEPWLTQQSEFRDVSRGKPKPHSLGAAKRKEVGLTRDTWKLEVVDDPHHKCRVRNPLTKETNTAFTFKDLMKLAEKRAVRFPKLMTCLNIGCPLGNGIWEGVPLRDVIWLAQPRPTLRRVFYYGYHNDDPKQMFRSSLPIGRVLEDMYGLRPSSSATSSTATG
jgi:DMSO/TMAO reductase YedYZ molybdopterin-dependent catalytic subunit